MYSKKPLTSLSIPIALQLLCILSTPSAIGYAYHLLGRREWWRLIFILAGVLAVTTQISLQWCHGYAFIVVMQGAVLGAALGTLFTISTLVLATHYKSNLPLVSMQSGFASFTGAVCHTVLARQSFRTQISGVGGFAQAASGGLLGGTVLVAYLLMKRVKPDDGKPWTTRYQLKMQLPKDFVRDLVKEGTMWFVLGYMLIFFGIFIYPLYIVLILTQPPALYFPDTGTIALLATLSTAALSGCVSANEHVRKRLGPVNTFIAAAIFVGAVVLAPVRMPRLYVTITLGGLYGLALGAVLTLHIMVAAVFLSPNKMWQDDMPARVAIVMALGSISAFAGIIALASVMEMYENGLDIALRVAGGCMIGGGSLIAAVRVWRWRKFFYAV
jgi:hypothetical protein